MRAIPLKPVAPLRLGLPLREAYPSESTTDLLLRIRPPSRPYLSLGAQRANGNSSAPWCASRAKRFIDIVLALAFCAIAFPVSVLIAAAIKLDNPGGVFFKQWRTGLYGRRFQIVKFRTMGLDAEQRKESLQHLNRHKNGSPDFKIVNDPRVTRVGRFLRATSLDELPNLINVFKGDMSIIGPRPTSFGVDRYADWHLVRLTVPPGMTGLWQISGRSEVDFDERVRLDYRYIQDQSFSLDLKILALTPLRVFERRGAC
jgi:lipopolysaccharide/colanic/teichoic acid biosynthesis glycosyltransferase